MSNRLRTLTLLRTGGQLLAWLVAVAGCVASAWFYGTAIDRTGGFPGEPQLSRPQPRYFHPVMSEDAPKPPPGESWTVARDPDSPPEQGVFVVGPRRPDGTVEPRYYFTREAGVIRKQEGHR